MEFPLFKVRISSNASKAVESVFQSGWTGQGKISELFEEKISNFVGAKSLVVNSCTSAMHMAFKHISESCHTVLTTPLTCFATTASILNNGLKIKWVDIDPKTFNMDQNDLKNKLEKGCAVCFVHFAGKPNSIPEWLDVPIVEDCAHAFGSTNVGNDPRTFGCFSFQSVKSLSCGDGGAIVPPVDLLEKMEEMRWYGINRKLGRDKDQDIKQAGFKFHMNDIAASIGVSNFELAQESVQTQKENAKFYCENLGLPYCKESSYWLFPLLVRRRNEFIDFMKEEGIECSPVHYRNDVHSCVSEFQTHLPNMDAIENNLVCIPNGWWITPVAREFILEKTQKCIITKPE